MHDKRPPQRHALLSAAADHVEDCTQGTEPGATAAGPAAAGFAQSAPGPIPQPATDAAVHPDRAVHTDRIGSADNDAHVPRRLDAEPEDSWRPLHNTPKLGAQPEDRLPPNLKPLPANTICSSQALTKAYALAFIFGPLACWYVRRKTPLQFSDVRDGLAEMFNAQVAGIVLLTLLFLTHRALPGLSITLGFAYYILWAIVAYQPIRGILKARTGQKYTNPFVVEFIKPTDSYLRPKLTSRGAVIPHQACPESTNKKSTKK